MRTIHTETGVLAPAEVVWSVLSDLAGWQRWNPFLWATGEMRLGAAVEIVASPPGRGPVRVRARIVRLQEGRELRWRSRMLGLPGLFDGEHGFRVTPEDVGRCRFEQFECFSGLLAAAVLSRSEKAITTGFTAMNRALKREAERLARERG